MTRKKQKVSMLNRFATKRSLLPIALIGSILIAAGGYAYTRISGASEIATNINVGTYNLRSQRWDGTSGAYADWSVRKTRVKSMISTHKPGIIGMQEVIKRNPDTQQYVSQRNDVIDFMTAMNYGYVVGSVDNSSPLFWKKDNFTKLMSGERLIYDPINSQREDPPAARYLTYARLQQVHHKKNVLVFNYHVNQFEQVDAQLKTVAGFVANMRNVYPNDDIIFTGDFNNKHSGLINALAAKSVRLRLADKNAGVDHVLISPKVAIRSWVSTGLGSPPASDHPLIIVRLTI